MRKTQAVSRRFPLLLAFVAMAIFRTAMASAERGSTIPRPGSYKGPAKTSVELFPAYAKVSRSGNQTSISLDTSLILICDNGGHYPGGLTVTAKTRGETFSHVGTSKDAQGTYLYKLTGRFTKSTSFKGTLSAKGTIDIGSDEKPTCTTGTITFTLFRTKG